MSGSSVCIPSLLPLRRPDIERPVPRRLEVEVRPPQIDRLANLEIVTKHQHQQQRVAAPLPTGAARRVDYPPGPSGERYFLVGATFVFSPQTGRLAGLLKSGSVWLSRLTFAQSCL